MSQQKVRFENRNGQGITLSAVINFPENFDKTRKYPAIVSTHPGGGVKEQTAGLYAKRLAEAGFITVAYDASYQGESTGEPRQLENPYIRTEDISAVIDYLTTLPYVDRERIGAIGVCAGGGYAANAAINDHRIKAVGTISAVNIGAMFRNGWDGSLKPADAFPMLMGGADARTAEANGAAISTFPLAPATKEEAPNKEMEDAWEYYRTARAQCSTAPSVTPVRCFTQLVTYDAFNLADVYLTQPLQIVAGSEAGSRWMSEKLYNAAASADKNLHIVEGANHMEMYDVPQYVDEAVGVLTSFFRKNIG
ncbi:MAG: alpha/beta hydrolase [Parabacteroides sp.]|nr:alpha/beta hydrolase [Parabacteroides sp.]